MNRPRRAPGRDRARPVRVGVELGHEPADRRSSRDPDRSSTSRSIRCTQSIYRSPERRPERRVVTITDARGVTRDVPVRVAYLAGTVPTHVDLADHRRPRVAGLRARASRRGAVARGASCARARQAVARPMTSSVSRQSRARSTSRAFDVPVLHSRQRLLSKSTERRTSTSRTSRCRASRPTR